MFPQATVTVLLVINSAGLVILIGFSIVAYRSYKKAKAAADLAKKKAAQAADAAEEFLNKLKRIAAEN